MVKNKNIIYTIFAISIVGILFSGVLSYFELFQKTCPVGGCSNLLGLPVCVYGLIMYCIIFFLSLSAIKYGK